MDVPPSLQSAPRCDDSAIHRLIRTLFVVRGNWPLRCPRRSHAPPRTCIKFRAAAATETSQAPVRLPTLSLPPALSATRRMAAEHSVNDIQEQLQALFKLVDDQPEYRDPYPKPTVTEGNKILAVKKDWLKSICCLNLIMTHKFVDRVWQSLQQRHDTLKTALNDGRALRFDVMVLGIASHRTLCPVRLREGCRADTASVQVPLNLPKLLENLGHCFTHASLFTNMCCLVQPRDDKHSSRRLAVGNGSMKPLRKRMNGSAKRVERLLSRDGLTIGEGGSSESSKSLHEYTSCSSVTYRRNKTGSACRTGSMPAISRQKKIVTASSPFSHTGVLLKCCTSFIKC